MATLTTYAAAASRSVTPIVPPPPLPTWDPSDDWGLVHVTQPPDLRIPDAPTRDFFRGDPFGVMVSPVPPFVDGANTTPPEMTMSFLLPKYVQFGTAVVDRILTAHKNCTYDTFHLDRRQADDAGLSDSQFTDLIAYVHSWGFFTSIWFSSSRDDRSGGWNTIGQRISQFQTALISRGQAFLDKVIALPGQELNNGCPPGLDGADSIISHVCTVMNSVGVPVYLHFTANYPGYPENVPPPEADAAMVKWIAQWSGRVRGLYAQMDSYNPVCKIGGVDRPYGDPASFNHGTKMLSSAGYMGAKLWDIRRFWARALGMSGHVVAFELLGDPQLYGNCSEPYSALRGLEMLYCTSDGSAPPVYGGCAARMPDGTKLRNT